MSGSETRSLRAVFEEALVAHGKVTNWEGGTMEERKEVARASMRDLMLAKNMVDSLEMFSENEELEDINTAHLRFLLIDILIADLMINAGDMSKRKDCLESAMDVLNRFLDRMDDINIITQEQRQIRRGDAPADPASKRTRKIQAYELDKKLDSKCKELVARLALARQRGMDVEDEDNDEMTRAHWETMLRLWSGKALAHLNLIPEELAILSHMEDLRLGRVDPAPPQAARKPMKPMVLTKEMLRNGVFGTGYPSMPTMSVEEYGDQVMAQYNKDEAARAARGAPSLSTTNDHDPESEDEDDEEVYNKSRKKLLELDTWNDNHKRGEGNTYNKG